MKYLCDLDQYTLEPNDLSQKIKLKLECSRTSQAISGNFAKVSNLTGQKNLAQLKILSQLR